MSFAVVYSHTHTLLLLLTHTHTHVHTTVGCVWYPYWSLYAVCLYRRQLVDCSVSKGAILPRNATPIPLYLPSINNRFRHSHTSMPHAYMQTYQICFHKQSKYLGTKNPFFMHTHMYSVCLTGIKTYLMKSLGHKHTYIKTHKISIGSIIINAVAAARNNRV